MKFKIQIPIRKMNHLYWVDSDGNPLICNDFVHQNINPPEGITRGLLHIVSSTNGNIEIKEDDGFSILWRFVGSKRWNDMYDTLAIRIPWLPNGRGTVSVYMEYEV